MSKQIKNGQSSIQRQCGAVAIIVAICLTLLVGMLGLVLDLGHLYVAKTELQNAADAGALSGAKELNGRMSGINNAITRAIEATGKNKYDLNSDVVTITSANISVGTTPDDMVPITSITSDALAADKTFLEVDTGSLGLNTWFIQVLSVGTASTTTFGRAVAGKYAVNITPIAICRMPDSGTFNELGYERGLSYKVSDANPIGSGTMYWIDPESSVPGVCPVTSTNETRPYVCTGKTAFTPIVGETVNTNTGISTPQLEALDSRFDLYGAQGQCDPATAPPDINVRQYKHSDPVSTQGSPRKWMGTDAVQQSITFVDAATNGPCQPNNPCKPKPYNLRTASDYGVLWSKYRPAGRVVADWPSLYAGNTATSYPETSPHAQTSGEFTLDPSAPHQPGVAGRRVLNMVIVECATAGGVCRPAEVLGVGRFFMQRESNISTDRNIYVEFGGLLPTPLPTSDIKLYR